MDRDKLRAFLDSRKSLNQGQILGIPVQLESVPSLEEIEVMPEDLKQLVIDQQFKRASHWTPAVKGTFEPMLPKVERQEQMAEELKLSAREAALKKLLGQ